MLEQAGYKVHRQVTGVKMKGAQIFLESLIREQVKVIFGYPGGSVLDVYNYLYESKLQHILVRHEQAAVHAADGYARATGDVGVCLVTSGPGATNTVTGIATAYMDSIPIVVFTGQVPTMLIGNDAFQEADIVGITRPCTKHNYLVRDVKEIADDDKGSVLHCPLGTPGAGAGRSAQGRAQGKRRLPLPGTAQHAQLPPHLQGQQAPDRACS